MGKKRVQSQSRNTRQVRQVRQVRPKNLPAPAAGGGDQRKQRERFVQAGGMLQGYAPESVVRMGYIAAGAGAACLLIMAVLLLFLPYGWPVPAGAAAVWLIPIVVRLTLLAQGVRLALND